jgi:NADH-quinone oxidoreductase subunit E
VTVTRRVLTDERLRDAERIIAKYPNKRSAILPLLFLTQSIEGYVSEQGMREVAALLELTPAQVLATASFYTMLKKRPQGEYLISVCRNISCTHRGARKIIDAFEERLGVEAGQTTPDGKFELETAECLATCDGAPSIQVNYEDFYDLTPVKAAALVDRLSAGQEVRSARGQRVQTSSAISREVAMTGVGLPDLPADARTVAGEVPAADMAPSTRPKAPGDVGAEREPLDRHLRGTTPEEPSRAVTEDRMEDAHAVEPSAHEPAEDERPEPKVAEPRPEPDPPASSSAPEAKPEAKEER